MVPSVYNIVCTLFHRLEHHEVTLPPGFVCDRCILQIERQAAEFSWIDTVFWSCADVTIVDSPGRCMLASFPCPIPSSSMLYVEKTKIGKPGDEANACNLIGHTMKLKFVWLKT
jgi:hypothetical protein